MIALPIFLQIGLEYNALEAGLSLAPLSLTMFAVAMLAGRRAGEPPPRGHHPRRLRARHRRHGAARPDRARRRLRLVARIPLVVAGAGLGLLVSQLNNYTLAPIEEERISEAAGVNSAARVVRALVRPGDGRRRPARDALARVHQHDRASPVIPAAQQQQIADTLEHDAQVVSNSDLEVPLADEPPEVQDEVLQINHDSTDLALQVALLVPILAGLLGFLNSFRMLRLPDIEPSASLEGAALG